MNSTNPPPTSNQPRETPSAKFSITWKDINLSSYVVYGSLFVFAIETLLYPFDLIRTQMQADNVMSGHTIRQVAMRNIKQEGWTRLFRGILPTIAVGFPAQGTYYISYEFSHYKYEQWFRRINGNFFPHHDFLCHALAGCTAEMASSLLYLPADTITQRLQSQPKFNFLHRQYHYHGALDAIRGIYTHSGIPGFYRGLLPHLAAYLPAGGMYWGVYETVKQNLHSNFQKSDLWMTIVAGGCAGAASVCASNPFDVLRTRMQTYTSLNLSMRQFALSILQHEGLQGFMKGWKPRFLTAVPGSMVALSGYELIKRWSL